MVELRGTVTAAALGAGWPAAQADVLAGLVAAWIEAHRLPPVPSHRSPGAVPTASTAARMDAVERMAAEGLTTRQMATRLGVRVNVIHYALWWLRTQGRCGPRCTGPRPGAAVCRGGISPGPTPSTAARMDAVERLVAEGLTTREMAGRLDCTAEQVARALYWLRAQGRCGPRRTGPRPGSGAGQRGAAVRRGGMPPGPRPSTAARMDAVERMVAEGLTTRQMMDRLGVNGPWTIDRALRALRAAGRIERRPAVARTRSPAGTEAEREALRTAKRRPCLCCGRMMRSTGPGHRLCDPCRARA